MTELSQDILNNWQVRKTARQKTAFIEMLQARLPELRVDKCGAPFPDSRNLVLGNVHTARVLYTAHYDTCARLPFPNFITPKNFLIYLLYQLLICIPFFAVMGLVTWGLKALGVNPVVAVWAGYIALMVSMFYVLMFGPANRHTANDNTSGVITLIELYSAMTPEQRAKCAFIFFDNEENGLRGSGSYLRKYRKQGVGKKLLVNFDCVSDGDYIMLVLNKKAHKQHRELFAQCYRPEGSKQVLVESAKNTFYPSDQKNFELGVGVAALNHKPIVGYYMDKIHTPRDTVFDKRNIELLVRSSVRLTDRL